MGPGLTKLLEISSQSLCKTPAILTLELERMAGGISVELIDMLKMKNGFYAFESALHIFPTCSEEDAIDITSWNSLELWRSYYGELANGFLFFAEDAFGFQFAIKNRNIYSFNSETGETTLIGSTLEDWAKAILNDADYQTGYPLAHDWQIYNRPLQPGERLFPKYPFVLGGKYELSNLVVSNAVYGMQFRGYVAQQIKDLPEGTKVELVFNPLIN